MRRNAAGVYQYIHGGGWVFGSPDNKDKVLDRIANNTECTVASVAYRLAPQFPYPAAVKDCIDAALYLLWPKNLGCFGPLRVIGGESTGAHLAMYTTFTLRKAGVDLRAQLNCIVFNHGCLGSVLALTLRDEEDLLMSAARSRVYAFIKGLY